MRAVERRRRFNIIDGITGMEGDGPIRGVPRGSGVLVFGADPVAVDGTGARLMGMDPHSMPHMAQAGRFLGKLEVERIEQLGEDLDAHAQDYVLLEAFRHLRPTLSG